VTPEYNIQYKWASARSYEEKISMVHLYTHAPVSLVRVIQRHAGMEMDLEGK
jgi:hypothetical protein